MNEKDGNGPSQDRSLSPLTPAAISGDVTTDHITKNVTVEHSGSAVPYIRGHRTKKRPIKSIVFKVFARWIITVIFALAIAGVLIAYSAKSVLSKSEKRKFNALITGFSIALGLAIVASLDGMVSEVRWWILSRRYRSRHKVESILKADSMVHLVLLAAKSRRYSIHAAVLSWLIVILASQVGVASVGLCYSVDTVWKKTLLYDGNITIPDMSRIQTERVVMSNAPSLGGQQYTANNFGIISLGLVQGDQDNVPRPGSVWYPGDPQIFCQLGFCRFYFHDTSTESIIEDELNPVVINTRRYVDATASCQSWPVSEGGDGSENSIVVDKGAGAQNISIPTIIGAGATIFITDVTEGCGFGCSRLSVLETSAQQSWYYECDSRIGNVTNSERPEHEVGNHLATMSSRAIALQGVEVSSLVNNSNIQYQVYPSESVYGTPANGSTPNMEILIERFAIGVVATAAQYNTMLNVTGKAPALGEGLSVKHPGIIIVVLVLIVVLQLLLDVGFAWVANQVVVPHGSVISIAEVLRPMLAHEGREKDDERTRPGGLWIYTCRKVSEDEYDIYMSEDAKGHQEGEDVH